MSNFALITPDVQSAEAYRTVTVSGIIKASNGARLRRKIAVFVNNNMTAPLTIQESGMPLGDFSFQVDGHPTTEFCVIAKGQHDENDVIFAHCTEVGGGSGDYTAPALAYLDFTLGEDDLSSPYTDIYVAAPTIEAEAECTIIGTGDFICDPVIEAEATNPILAQGEVAPTPSIEGEAFNYFLLYGDVNQKAPAIDGTATNVIIASGDIRPKLPEITAFTTDVCDIYIAAPTIEGIALTPIIATGNYEPKAPVMSGEGNAEPVVGADLILKVARLEGVAVVSQTATGNVGPNAPTITSTASVHLIAQGDIATLAPILSGSSSVSDDYETVEYDRYYRCNQ